VIRWSSLVRAIVLVVLVAVTSLEPAFAQGLRLTGLVVDAATQAPVAGAEVEVRNAGGGPGYYRTRTDATGAFTLDRVAADRWYAVTVMAAGYSLWAVDNWQFPAAQREARLTVPLDRAGRTGFRGEVLEALEAVEFGGTVSYGELAALAGRPRAARAVGTAMSTNPIPILVPCHRVLRAGGDIGEYGGGIEAKVWLLAMEKAAGRSAVGAGR